MARRYSRSKTEHAHRSAGARRAIRGRKRNARGQLMNPVESAFANPYDRRGRKYSKRKRSAASKKAIKHRKRNKLGQLQNPKRSHSRSRALVLYNPSRSQAAKRRKRDRFGHFMNPAEMAAFMNPGAYDGFMGPYGNPFENPRDSLGRKYSKRKRSVAGKKAAKHRKRNKRGEFKNPTHHASSRSLVLHRGSRSKMARHHYAHPSRYNPFDENGYWHTDERGVYGHLPNRKFAKKRSEFARGVASHRSRNKRGQLQNPFESFSNPFENPFALDAFGSAFANPFENPRRAKTRGAEHRRRSKAAKKSIKRRRRRPDGRLMNPSTSFYNPFENPKKGRKKSSHKRSSKKRSKKRVSKKRVSKKRAHAVIRRGGAGSGARGGYMGRTIVMSRPYIGE